jgi:hypothetical protein
MLWVTRSHVHVDRVACPWLIRRFVDSDARFLFVSKNRVAAVAEEAGGIPFDAPGVELGHHGGKCSFEAILAKYELSDPALERMARVVHAADIAADLHADELAPGLEALATGFGVLFADDEANLQAQFVVYDALYAWCRLNTVNA